MPHADSQLKQIDGMIQYLRRSFFGQLVDSKSSKLSHSFGAGCDLNVMIDDEWRMPNAEWRSMTDASMSNVSAERNRLSGFYPDILPGAGAGEREQADEDGNHC